MVVVFLHCCAGLPSKEQVVVVWEMASHSMATMISVLVTEHCSASGIGTGHKVGIILSYTMLAIIITKFLLQ